MGTSVILVLVLIDIMIINIIILIGRMIGDTYRMNSRKKNHLILMEM